MAELTQGVRNANDGVSTLQIIDGGLNNITKMLDRLKTLATESATDTLVGRRRHSCDSLDAEFQALLTRNRPPGRQHRPWARGRTEHRSG